MATKRKNARHIPVAPFKTYDTVLKTMVHDRDGEKRAAERKIQQATPERVQKADILEISPDKRQYVSNSPLDVLYAKGAFNENRNDQRSGRHCEFGNILYSAGRRYRETRFAAGLSGISAQNIDSIKSGDGNPAWLTPVSEHAAHNRAVVREVREKLGDYLFGYLDAIVGEELSPRDAGSKFSHRVDRTVVTAVAVDVLRASLVSLAQHWGMLARRKS